MSRRYEIDMCHGPLLKKIIVFAIPLMASSILQLFYNAADVAVVGRFAGKEALAAVGSTGALTNLIINLLLGLSIGTSVLTSNYYGAGKMDDVSETVHTSVAVALLGGILFGLFGYFACTPLLRLMATPEDVIDGASIYMRIYFLGLPATMLYNFGSAILRAVGDTRHPLYYLIISGIINVVLNLVFVIAFHMAAAGVALATLISQVVSVVLVFNFLLRTDSVIRVDIKKLRINGEKLKSIMRIGLPAGFQSTVFSISNVIIQSSVNSFGSVTVAANSASGNIEGFVATGNNAMHQAAMSFSSQNRGAGKYRRIGKVMLISSILAVVYSVSIGTVARLFGTKLLTIYTTDAEVIETAMIRLSIMTGTYFICAVMDVFTGEIRGMGYSILPMLVTVIGVCGIRLTWLFTVFPANRTLETLYNSYPVSWLATTLVHLICFVVAYRKMLKEHPTDSST